MTEIEWRIYRCTNEMCEGFWQRWPVRKNEGVAQRRCPACNKNGRMATVVRTRERTAA